MRKPLYPFFFFLFLAVIFILPLGQRDLFSPDEDRYAEIAREMIQSGDYITPRLNGVLYFEKPVLGYWLIVGAQKIFGENPFSARLPSMLSILICALVVFLFAKQMRPGKECFPYMAAAIFMATPLVFALGGMAILDPAFAMFLTLGMYFFYQAVRDREKLWTPRAVLFQIFSGAAFGAAFLTKGFLAFALPGGAIVVYMLLPEHRIDLKPWRWYQTRLLEFVTLPLLPLLSLLAVVLPWSIAIHKVQPMFWNYFFWEEHIKRFTEKQQHPEPFWYFVPVLFAGFAYLVPLIWPAVRGLRKRSFDQKIRYLLCWAWVPFFLLSLSSGKLGTYILPCCPPLALLLADGLFQETVEDDRTCFLRGYFRIFGLVLMAGMAGFMIYHFTVPEKYCLYTRRETILTLLPLFFCGLFAGLSFLLAAKKDFSGMRCWALAGIALVPIFFCWQKSIPEMILRRKSPQPLLRQMVYRFGTDAELYSDNYPFQAVCWAFRSNRVSMLLRDGELEKGIIFAGDYHRIVFKDQFLARVNDPKRKKTILVVMPTSLAQEYFEEWMPLPKAMYSDNSNDKRTYVVLQY